MIFIFVSLVLHRFPETTSYLVLLLVILLSSESYAGVYIPTLSKEVLDNTSIHLVGIAVGDPCTDNTAQADSMDALWYGYKYGLVDEQTYDVLWNQCEIRSPNLMTRGGKHLVAAELNKLILKKKQMLTAASKENGGELKESDINKELRTYAEELWMDLKVQTKRNRHNHEHQGESDECKIAQRKFLISTSAGLSQGWSDLFIDDYSLFAPVSNKEDEEMANYMMRADVRKALHVEDAPTQTWPEADVGFDYTKEYDACNEEVEEGAWSMINFYQDIVPRLKIAWIYNGDTDPCVSYEGTRTAVKRIGFNELDGGSYRPWFYNHTAASVEVLVAKAPLYGPDLLAQDMGPQFAGEVANYENNLAFLTFHGSGHMVPQFRPQSALKMVEKLLNFEDLAPLLPKNQTLASMSLEDYEQEMDRWTKSAQTWPYVKEGPSQISASKKGEKVWAEVVPQVTTTK